MKSGKRLIGYIICTVLGVVLLLLGTANADSYWSGMGSGLVAVSIVQMIRVLRIRNDESYREKMEIEMSDERNKFIRTRAWAWAGYFFIIVAGFAVIVLKLLGHELLSFAAGCAVCMIVAFYWVAYLILQRKY